MAQNREVKLELKPTALKAEPVKIEQINNQDILRVASQADTIRIPLTDDTWAQIETSCNPTSEQDSPLKT